MFQPPNKKLARASNVDIHIAVHGMLGQQINAEFFACFGEAEESVDCYDIGEDSAAFVVVDHFEELEGGFFGTGWDDAVFGCVAEIVDSGVLVVECFV